MKLRQSLKGIYIKIRAFNVNTNFGIILIAVLLLCLPVVIDLAMGGETVPFRYFSADSFYYFTVARNFALTGMLTFDQSYPTNGFHPLWQLLTALLYKISLLLWLPETTYLIVVLCTNMMLVSLGVALTGLAFINIRKKLPTSFILVPVGIYALLILPAWVCVLDIKGYQNQLEGPTPLYGTMWSFMNGMESGLVIFFFGLLFFVFTRYVEISRFHSILFGFIASLLVLSRLDHIFIVVGLLLFFCLDVLIARNKFSIQKLFLFSVCLTLPIAGYMLINYNYANAIMPVSASAKTTFPVPNLENLYHLILVLRYPFNDHTWLDRFYRTTQIIIPSIAAIFALRQWKNDIASSSSTTYDPDRVDLFLSLMGVGVLGLAFYNFFFVQFYGVGHWYFPISILYTSLVFINMISRTSKSMILPRWKPLLYSLGCLLIFFTLHRRIGYHDNYIRFYFDEAPQVQSYYRQNPPKLIGYDDGIIAFALGYPTMSGFGFMLDQEAFVELEKGNLVELAFERGFDRITSLSYKNFSQTGSGDPEIIWFLPVDKFEFSVEYASPDQFFGIIRIDKKTQAADDQPLIDESKS